MFLGRTTVKYYSGRYVSIAWYSFLCSSRSKTMLIRAHVGHYKALLWHDEENKWKQDENMGIHVNVEVSVVGLHQVAQCRILEKHGLQRRGNTEINQKLTPTCRN